MNLPRRLKPEVITSAICSHQVQLAMNLPRRLKHLRRLRPHEMFCVQLAMNLPWRLKHIARRPGPQHWMCSAGDESPLEIETIRAFLFAPDGAGFSWR